MKIPPNQYRVRQGVLASDDSYGSNGVFVLPHPKIKNYQMNCIISNGENWEHVSVTLYSPNRVVDRCPTWEEMCFVKEMFWEDDEAVMQLHPPKSEYVNNHKYCLHLWRPLHAKIPLPDSLMVGYK